MTDTIYSDTLSKHVPISSTLTTDQDGIQWMPLWVAHRVLDATDKPEWVDWANLVISDSEDFPD